MINKPAPTETDVENNIEDAAAAAAGGSETKPEDILSMSDDELANMVAPPGSEEVAVEDDEPASDATGSEDEPEAAEADDEDSEQQADTAEDPDADGSAEPAANGGGEAAAEGADNSAAADPAPTGEVEAKTPTAEEYEGFYKKVMAPFKANGKTIELRTPEEAIQLMQMGANYTRKLQDIQPHRKALLMLQNNDLLDEGKLSFLIDLDKKNPEAIKKLIKDAGIDPLDIDTSVEPDYLEGNHRVTDEEASFRQTLDEVMASPAGKETVQIINADWDDASKDVLWKSPEIMTIIHSQRENGVYDLIVSEMDRQKTLGQISADTPFLEAYKIVGDQLAEAKKFDHLADQQTPAQQNSNPGVKPEPAVVATRVATPKSQVTNGDKASAASPSRSTPRAAKAIVNPLSLADDEFLSQMQNRL